MNPPSNKVCSFWAQGNCRKGNACKFLHQQPAAAGGGFAAPNNGWGGAGGAAGGFVNNGFAGAAGPGMGMGGPQQQAAAGRGAAGWNKQRLKQQIATDFNVTKTVWPFSSYGIPSEPSLMPGDYSFEEVRYNAYVEGAAGRFAQQVQVEKDQVMRMNEEKMKLAKNPYHFVQPQQGGGIGGGIGGGGGLPPAGGAPGAWGGSPNGPGGGAMGGGVAGGGGYSW